MFELIFDSFYEFNLGLVVLINLSLHWQIETIG